MPRLDSVSSIAGMLISGKFANCSVTSLPIVAVPVTSFAAFAAW